MNFDLFLNFKNNNSLKIDLLENGFSKLYICALKRL